MIRTVAEHFTRIRTAYPTLPATVAHEWAKHEHAVDKLDAALDWDWRNVEYGAFKPGIVGTLDDVIEVRVYDDAETYDWGDIEPSEQERRDLQVIGVGVRIVGDDDDLDNIWGVGYLHGDAEREAASTALQYGFIDAAKRELAERERLAGFVETVV